MTSSKQPKPEPLRRPLTDFEIKYLWLNVPDYNDLASTMMALARAVEAAHGIRQRA